MPLVQSCNPVDHGRTFNTKAQSTMGVGIEVRWDWDGVSVYPDCDGPLVNGTGGGNTWAVRATNPTDSTWYVHTIRARDGQAMTYSIVPGQTVTLTANQAAANGYDSIKDWLNLTLTTTP